MLTHNLWSGNVTEDNHGKKFVSNEDKFFEALARENKTKATAAAMMEAQHEIPNEEEAYDKYACYDGSTTTMESCDDKECKERLSRPIDDTMGEDKAKYKEELPTNAPWRTDGDELFSTLLCKYDAQLCCILFQYYSISRIIHFIIITRSTI
jgi:hypothetical protein